MNSEIRLRPTTLLAQLANTTHEPNTDLSCHPYSMAGLETKRFSRHAWRVNDVVRPKTVERRKDLQSFSKHSRTPITRVTMRLVSGLAILSLNPSPQMKLTDDYAAGNTDAHKTRSMSAVA